MPSMKRTVQILSVLPLLFLAACGDGWEMRPYDNTPYDGDRTAGHGVQYVRAHMMPKKGPVLEPEMKEEKPVAKEPAVEPPKVVPPEPVEEPEIDEGDKVFNKMQKK